MGRPIERSRVGRGVDHARDSDVERPQPLGHFVAEGLCHPPPKGRRKVASSCLGRSPRALPRRQRRRGWHVPERGARGIVVAPAKSLARERLARSTKARRRQRRRVPIPKAWILEQWVAQSNDLEWAAARSAPPAAPKLAAAAASAQTRCDHNPSATPWPRGCATRRPRGGGRSRVLASVEVGARFPLAPFARRKFASVTRPSYGFAARFHGQAMCSSRAGQSSSISTKRAVSRTTRAE